MRIIRFWHDYVAPPTSQMGHTGQELSGRQT